tara:strand:+ start:103 stop:654 length:552 start_codon:yes stop_codon:yes gene_type:complete
MKRVFRFDDICINTDMEKANKMARILLQRFENCEVLFCISPLVHDMGKSSCKTSERIYPKIYNAHSDFKIFYNVDACGVPDIIPEVTRVSHGLIHVDHRLLSREAQEMSILTSCSLAKSKVFVPPFNKWNKDSEDICREHNIQLVKFEDGWLCMEYNDFNPDQELWYIHSREFTLDSFREWLA